jgi:GDPmannose 4,6-dehydratase
LAELLLSKGYEIHGTVRRSSSFNTGRIDSILGRLHLHHADMTDATSLRRVLGLVRPTEVYNLAAQSHVRVSFDEPEYTHNVNALGTLRLLEAIRDMGDAPRVYQASSSEMFGSSPAPQNESTPFCPRSPYGVSKLAAHWYARHYREAHGLFVACGILFNHESPRRGETFVTRKITRALGRGDKTIALGNLDARRDWGFAGDYVEAMWLMLQCDVAKDVVIATGESHTVREWLEEAMRGSSPRHLEVTHDPRYDRPTEVHDLRGNAETALFALGWKPRVRFKDLVRMMVEADRV